MYSMVHTLSRVPYAGVKGMLQTIFGLDHLGDDTLAIKTALLKVCDDTLYNVFILIVAIITALHTGYSWSSGAVISCCSQDRHQPVSFLLPLVVEATNNLFQTCRVVSKFEDRWFAICFLLCFLTFALLSLT